MLQLARSFQERTTTAWEAEQTPVLGEAAGAGEDISITAGCGSEQHLPALQGWVGLGVLSTCPFHLPSLIFK